MRTIKTTLLVVAAACIMVPIFICLGTWVGIIKVWRRIIIRDYPRYGCCDSVPRCPSCPYRPGNEARMIRRQEQEAKRLAKAEKKRLKNESKRRTFE